MLGARKSKRPDRLAIRASCVTIARQPPWSFESAGFYRTWHPPRTSGQTGLGEGLASPVGARLSPLNTCVALFRPKL
jgi:hypothetical protein